MSLPEPAVQEIAWVRSGEKEAGGAGMGVGSLECRYSQGTRAWRCRAPQSGHGRQRKREPSGQCLTKHSTNEPGSQPQRVSATAEQFFRATWEAGGGGGVQEGGESRSHQGQRPPHRGRTDPPEYGDENRPETGPPQKGEKFRDDCRPEAEACTEIGKSAGREGQGGGPGAGGHRALTPKS